MPLTAKPMILSAIYAMKLVFNSEILRWFIKDSVERMALATDSLVILELFARLSRQTRNRFANVLYALKSTNQCADPTAYRMEMSANSSGKLASSKRRF